MLDYFSDFDEEGTIFTYPKEKTLGEDFQWWWNMTKYIDKEIPAREFSDIEIKCRHASMDNWPDKENQVSYWVELENGYAVGYCEKKRGNVTFPVVKMTE